MKRSIELIITAGMILCDVEATGTNDKILQTQNISNSPQYHQLMRQIQEEISSEKWAKVDTSLTDMPKHIFENFLENNTLDLGSKTYDIFKIAIKNGWMHLCKWALKENPDVLNFEYYEEESPLHLAVVGDHRKIVKMLIEEGADVNCYYNGNTPLHEAAWTDNPQMGQLLIDLGAYTNAKDNSGYIPLEIAVMMDKVNIADLLLDKELNNGNKFVCDAMLRFAFAYNSEKVIDLIFKKGVHFDTLILKLTMHWFIKEYYRASILGFRGDEKREEIIRNMCLFIEKGGDINFQKDEDIDFHADCYNTPLHLAAIGNLTEIVELLVYSGAQLDLQNWWLATPLHIATVINNKRMIKILVDGNANLNIQDELGNTPLHYAADNNDKEVMEILIRKGADINIKNHEDETPRDIVVNQGWFDQITEKYRLQSNNGGSMWQNYHIL